MLTYSDLIVRLKEIATLNSISAVLGWDEQVMMPVGATRSRSEQAALVATLMHERRTDPGLFEIVQEVAASDLDPDQKVVLRELRRDLDRASKLPIELVSELSRTTVLSQSAWQSARAEKNFKSFAPWLEKMVGLKREEAACYGSSSGDPYDALLEGYEPGETVASLRATFDTLVPTLVDLLGRVQTSGRVAPTHLLSRPLSVDAQRAAVAAIAEAIGFDTNAGRLDASVHPFCSGIAPGDTRITTRYELTDFLGALLGTLHEVGHALYEQGLPKEHHFGTALSEATSLGIHESQSRLWENQVGRGTAFWQFLWPRLKTEFPGSFDGVDPSEWLFALNAIEPSFIRTEADELTYNLHIAMRFDLERAMISGDLTVADLPLAWNDRIQSDLSLVVPDDAAGCLQDVHWSCGLFGYFPTYCLGNIYAATFFETVTEHRPGLAEEFSRGDFNGLLTWLRANIHCHGRRYRAGELCERISGKPRSTNALLRRLQLKASQYYGV